MFVESLLTGLSAHNKWLLSAQPYSYPPWPRKRAWKEFKSKGEEQCETVSSDCNVAIIIKKTQLWLPTEREREKGGQWEGSTQEGERHLEESK